MGKLIRQSFIVYGLLFIPHLRQQVVTFLKRFDVFSAMFAFNFYGQQQSAHIQTMQVKR